MDWLEELKTIEAEIVKAKDAAVAEGKEDLQKAVAFAKAKLQALLADIEQHLEDK